MNPGPKKNNTNAETILYRRGEVPVTFLGRTARKTRSLFPWYTSQELSRSFHHHHLMDSAQYLAHISIGPALSERPAGSYWSAAWNSPSCWRRGRGLWHYREMRMAIFPVILICRRSYYWFKAVSYAARGNHSHSTYYHAFCIYKIRHQYCCVVTTAQLQFHYHAHFESRTCRRPDGRKREVVHPYQSCLPSWDFLSKKKKKSALPDEMPGGALLCLCVILSLPSLYLVFT